jgi:putative transposase
MYAEERLKTEILNKALTKIGEAISPARDGQTGSDGTWHIGTAGLSDLYGQRDLLSVRNRGKGSERTDCKLAAQAHG